MHILESSFTANRQQCQGVLYHSPIDLVLFYCLECYFIVTAAAIGKIIACSDSFILLLRVIHRWICIFVAFTFFNWRWCRRRMTFWSTIATFLLSNFARTQKDIQYYVFHSIKQTISERCQIQRPYIFYSIKLNIFISCFGWNRLASQPAS